ncbi:MAG TPA: hypothetical protein VI895_04770 [Bdellovibrionota bacterium]|nr:hypothetical protein [Bdellovibrionota bacterium]
MKIIGLIGGTTWASTIENYPIINEHVGRTLGGHHSAKILLASIDFQEIEEPSHRGNWDVVQTLLIAGARRLENGGADLFLICANALHKVKGLTTSFKMKTRIRLNATPTAYLQPRSHRLILGE